MDEDLHPRVSFAGGPGRPVGIAGRRGGKATETLKTPSTGSNRGHRLMCLFGDDTIAVRIRDARRNIVY
jgi:hypothetical protein